MNYHYGLCLSFNLEDQRLEELRKENALEVSIKNERHNGSVLNRVFSLSQNTCLCNSFFVCVWGQHWELYSGPHAC
jgi:hypothetical protein